MRTARALAVLVVAVSTWAAPASAQGSGRVVVFTLPGITWTEVAEARTPVLDGLVERGSVAALAVRTASARPNVERGYLSLGAGNRAYVGGDDPLAHLAFPADAPFEEGTAAEALERRGGPVPEGDIVHVGFPAIQQDQSYRLYGAEAGALGEALAGAGIDRGVVNAADIATDPTPAELRRAAVLSIVDEAGVVDHGTLDGLLRAEADAPFGVTTDPDAFEAAVDRALGTARVVLAEPGETLRADEFTRFAEPDVQARHLEQAIERADVLLGRVTNNLSENDTLLVVSPSGPTYAPMHLTPVVAAGPGFEPGTWLTSPTTQRDGMVTISDVAPTVLDLLGLEVSDPMNGTPMSSGGDADTDPVSGSMDLDDASLFRESFAASVFYTLAGGLISVLAILAFVVFLGLSRRPLPLLIGVAYVILATPLAAHITRAIAVHDLGMAGAHLVLWSTAVVLAGLAYLVPGPRWAGGVLLLLVSAVAYGSDALLGGPLQLNGVFGHSPVVAGRFYGLSNPGHAIIYSATILGMTGLVELLGRATAPRWIAIPFVASVLAVGLPPFGANFGGLIAGVPAVAVAYAMARGRPIRWRWVVGVGVVAVALGAGLALLDLARPEGERTHLGRFAADIASGGVGSLATIVKRKAVSAINSLRLTQWTYVVPVATAVLALLLYRPRGVLRDVIPRHPVIRAGLTGALVAGVVGFAVNDSGIAIPALVLAHIVPFLVLMGVEELRLPTHVGTLGDRTTVGATEP